MLITTCVIGPSWIHTFLPVRRNLTAAGQMIAEQGGKCGNKDDSFDGTVGLKGKYSDRQPCNQLILGRLRLA